MAQESAAALIQRAKTDPAFMTKIMAPASIAERLTLLAAEGYDCTLEEIQEQSQLLSSAELETITGGEDEEAGVGPFRTRVRK